MSSKEALEYRVIDQVISNDKTVVGDKKSKKN